MGSFRKVKKIICSEAIREKKDWVEEWQMIPEEWEKMKAEETTMWQTMGQQGGG